MCLSRINYNLLPIFSQLNRSEEKKEPITRTRASEFNLPNVLQSPIEKVTNHRTTMNTQNLSSNIFEAGRAMARQRPFENFTRSSAPGNFRTIEASKSEDLKARDDKKVFKDALKVGLGAVALGRFGLIAARKLAPSAAKGFTQYQAKTSNAYQNLQQSVNTAILKCRPVVGPFIQTSSNMLQEARSQLQSKLNLATQKCASVSSSVRDTVKEKVKNNSPALALSDEISLRSRDFFSKTGLDAFENETIARTPNYIDTITSKASLQELRTLTQNRIDKYSVLRKVDTVVDQILHGKKIEQKTVKQLHKELKNHSFGNLQTLDKTAVKYRRSVLRSLKQLSECQTKKEFKEKLPKSLNNLKSISRYYQNAK